MRGHTLVWHSQLPAWLTDGSGPATTAAAPAASCAQHIRTEVGPLQGQDLGQWDVVNEAFNEDGTLRDSIWLQKLGPGYIEEAFR